jgi:hypothetical protein
MKKALIILAMAALVCVGLYSCKTVNDCPAYGKGQVNNIEKRA